MGERCFSVRCKWVGGTCPEVFWGSSALPVTRMGSKTHENHYEGLQI